MIGTDVCACGCGEPIVQMQTGRAREYIRSDRQMKREWKGWTLDEFDAACERLDTRKVSA